MLDFPLKFEYEGYRGVCHISNLCRTITQCFFLDKPFNTNVILHSKILSILVILNYILLYMLLSKVHRFTDDLSVQSRSAVDILSWLKNRLAGMQGTSSDVPVLFRASVYHRAQWPAVAPCPGYDPRQQHFYLQAPTASEGQSSRMVQAGHPLFQNCFHPGTIPKVDDHIRHWRASLPLQWRSTIG